MALFLRDEDVLNTVSMDSMLSTIESMQQHYGHGEGYSLPRRKIIGSSGMLAVMGGGLFYEGVLGVKTYTVVNGAYSFQVSLYDAGTGELLLYTQANRLGQLRTGATTGVAVKHLSNLKASTVGIIGTGYQASTQLEAVCKVRSIKSVKAFSRSQDNREKFAPVDVERYTLESPYDILPQIVALLHSNPAKRPSQLVNSFGKLGISIDRIVIHNRGFIRVYSYAPIKERNSCLLYTSDAADE